MSNQDKKFQRLNKKVSNARSAYNHGGLDIDDQRGARREYTRGQRQMGKLQAQMGQDEYERAMTGKIDFDEYRDD